MPLTALEKFEAERLGWSVERLEQYRRERDVAGRARAAAHWHTSAGTNEEPSKYRRPFHSTAALCSGPGSSPITSIS